MESEARPVCEALTWPGKGTSTVWFGVEYTTVHHIHIRTCKKRYSLNYVDENIITYIDNIVGPHISIYIIFMNSQVRDGTQLTNTVRRKLKRTLSGLRSPTPLRMLYVLNVLAVDGIGC